MFSGWPEGPHALIPMMWTSRRQFAQCLVGTFGIAVALGVCLLSGAGCQQMAAEQSAVRAVRTAGAVADAAPQAAQSAVQGAQATATATTQAALKAVNTVPGGQLALSAIPQSISAIPQAVLDQLNSLVTQNNVANWGKPKVVYIVDGRYIFVYPSGGLFQSNQPRVIIVDTIPRVARLERLQRLGY
jgi:hypothetical protein